MRTVVKFISFISLYLFVNMAIGANSLIDPATVKNTNSKGFPCSNLSARKIKGNPIPPNAKQIVIVEPAVGSKVVITTCQKTAQKWNTAKPGAFPGVVGEKGISPFGKKHEGDLTTPSGTFLIGPAFGSAPLKLKMEYKQITAKDKFIDDPDSSDYNTWVRGDTTAKSYEKMLQPDYKLGAVINYNVKPTISGRGSAIFMHIWDNPDTPTSGCVAMDEKNMQQVLEWLDEKQQPYILIFDK